MNNTRKNSNASQNNPTNKMRKLSNRSNSTASDPGISYNVFGTKNWRKNRTNTKNTTLKNIRNRVKAKNAASLARMMNQTQKRYSVVPKVNIPKMAKPSIFSTAKNVYSSAKFRVKTRKQERAGMNLLTANLNNPQNHNHLHPNYNTDPNLNRINSEYTRTPSSGIPGASFVQ
jgi:hypothetical protein